MYLIILCNNLSVHSLSVTYADMRQLIVGCTQLEDFPQGKGGEREVVPDDPIDIQRREKVKEAMIHAWSSYEKYAWGQDELQVQSFMFMVINFIFMCYLSYLNLTFKDIKQFILYCVLCLVCIRLLCYVLNFSPTWFYLSCMHLMLIISLVC